MIHEKLVIVGSIVFSFGRAPAKFSRAYTLQSSAADMPLVKSTQVSHKCVEVEIEGVPVRSIIDTGSDISTLRDCCCSWS